MFDPQADESASPGTPATSTPAEPDNTSAGIPVHPSRILRALRSAWRVLVVMTLVGAVLGWVGAKTLIARKFVASSVVLWEGVIASDGTPDVTHTTLQATIEGAKLPAVLLEVRDRLGRAEPVEKLASRIEVVLADESPIVVLRATTDNAAESVSLIDTLVTTFLAHSLRAEAARHQERARGMEANLNSARVALTAARERYNNFRRANNIVDLVTERTLAVQTATTLRTAANTALAEVTGEQARIEALRTASQNERPLEELSHTETLIDATRLGEAESELALTRARLGDIDPRVQARMAQIEALRARLAASGGAGVQSARAIGLNPRLSMVQMSVLTAAGTRASAVGRRETYERLAADARARLDVLMAAEGAATEMLAAVNLEELHIARLATEFSTARDVASHARSGFRVVSPGTAPPFPAPSARKVVMIVVPIVCAIVTIIAVLVRALWGLRVMVPTEAAFWSGFPVVAASHWGHPATLEGLTDLGEDLNLLSQGAVGDILIVPGGESERELVVRIVSAWTDGNTQDSKPASKPHRPHKASLRPVDDNVRERRASRNGTSVRVWDGELDSSALRRAARAATRVILVVSSGQHGALVLRGWAHRLGRKNAVGVVLVGLGPEFANHPDRVGDVEALWRASPTSSRTEPQ